MGGNGGWGRYISVMVTSHGDPMLADFLGLQRAETRLIKSKTIVNIIPLMRSEERRNIV